MPSYTPQKGTPYCLRMKISLVSSCWKDRYKGISRTIDIRSTATFEDLHDIIFDLFDRYDGHLWEFIFNSRSPWDQNCFRLLSWEDDEEDPEYWGLARDYTLEKMGLGPKSTFFYHFDMGDDWLHRIVVSSYQEVRNPDALCVLVKSQGKSPDQYPELDEDGEPILDDDDDTDDEEYKDER